MTPKEKAAELVDKFVSITLWNGYVTSAKECAYIAVDEILEVIQNLYFMGTVDYWQEVKEEIEKL